MDKHELADLRRDYEGRELTKTSVHQDPFEQFTSWLGEALNAEITDANAMTLSTAGADCRPTSRIVLLKGLDETGFVFFTNYESKKGRDIADNPNVSLSFFWPQLQRQVIVAGTAGKITTDESKAYFSSRPYDSKIGAWASRQSSEIASRSVLVTKFQEMQERFGDDVPLPPFWGGYRVSPTRFEFWQGRASRLHDRICYQAVENDWTIVRLSP
jgi:pyridoxamine 5'-phosphate oxidase